MSNYQIVRFYDGTKGYGKVFGFNYTGVNVPAQFIAMAITDYKFCRKETKK